MPNFQSDFLHSYPIECFKLIYFGITFWVVLNMFLLNLIDYKPPAGVWYASLSSDTILCYFSSNKNADLAHLYKTHLSMIPLSSRHKIRYYHSIYARNVTIRKNCLWGGALLKKCWHVLRKNDVISLFLRYQFMQSSPYFNAHATNNNCYIKIMLDDKF